MIQKIDISHKTVLFVAAFVLSLWVIYLIRDLLIILFVALIFMSALSPLVSFFERLKLPKALGIAVTYIIIITIVSGVLVAVLPPLIEESSRLIVTAPPLLTQALNLVNIDKSIFQSELTN